MPILPGDAGPKIAASLKRLKTRFEYEEFGGGPFWASAALHHLPRCFQCPGDQKRASSRRNHGRRPAGPTDRRTTRRGTSRRFGRWLGRDPRAARADPGVREKGSSPRRNYRTMMNDLIRDRTQDLVDRETRFFNDRNRDDRPHSDSLLSWRKEPDTHGLGDDPLREVASWPVDERLQLVEAVWDRIRRARANMVSSQTLKRLNSITVCRSSRRRPMMC